MNPEKINGVFKQGRKEQIEQSAFLLISSDTEKINEIESQNILKQLTEQQNKRILPIGIISANLKKAVALAKA